MNLFKLYKQIKKQHYLFNKHTHKDRFFLTKNSLFRRRFCIKKNAKH